MTFLGDYTKKALLFLFLFFLFFSGEAQNYKIKVYSESHGLAQNFVYTIFQDARGFIWMGTGEGLSRYDGHHFKTFTTKDGLYEDFVKCALVASDSTIWLGHQGGGITQYDGRGKFQKLSIDGTSFGTISSLLEDRDKNIWVATQSKGLIRVDTSGAISTYDIGSKHTLFLSMVEGIENTILIGTSEGLLIVELQGAEKDAVIKGKVEGIPWTKVTSIIPMSSGLGFWVGTEDEGLFEYIPGANGKDDALKQFIDYPGFKSNNILDLFIDSDSLLWINHAGLGFSKFSYDEVNDELNEIPRLSFNDEIDHIYIESIFQDKEGQIWIGTIGDGVYYLRDEIFTLYTPSEGASFTNVNTIFEDNIGNFWAGTDSGLLQIHPDKLLNQYIFYSSNEGIPVTPSGFLTDENGLPGNHITTLHQDKDGLIWIGTNGSGICSYDPETNEIVKLELSDLSLNNVILCVTEDHDGMLWIGTRDGVYRYNRETGAKTRYSTRDGLPHNTITQVFCDRNNVIWLASKSRSIALFKGESFSKVQLSDGTVINSDITGFAEDKEGYIWISTTGQGIYRYRNDSVQNFSKEDGLHSDYCYLIRVDKEDNIWVGHRTGISKYVPHTNTFVIFDRNYGFPEGEVNAAFKDHIGNLWFGTSNGMVKYDPDKDRAVAKEPNTFINEMWVFDSIEVMTPDLILPYRSKTKIKFEFLGLAFKDQEKVRYQVKLEGNDLNWSEFMSENSKTYQGLPDGKYTFKVKACNKEGVCNQTPVEYSFIIKTPFFKTLWFYALCLILFIGISLGYARYRLHRLRREKEKLEAIVTERTEELQEEKKKVEQLNEGLEELVEERTEDLRLENVEHKKTSERLQKINNDLDTFIYKASHDLKGPIASVMGLVTVSRIDVIDETALKYIGMIEGRLKRLDDVVIDLIEVTRVNQGLVNVSEIDVPNLVNEIKANIEAKENYKAIEWQIDIPENLIILTDQYLLNSILSNVMDNAEEFSDRAKENSFCKITAAKDKKGVTKFIFEDNGVGIMEDIEDKIYDMFFRATKSANESSGLGLYLAKNAVDKLAGTIEANSSFGEGTTFTICIPDLEAVVAEKKED